MAHDNDLLRTTARITTADGGSMQAYMVRPPGGPRPGLVIGQEIFGVNRSLRAIADDFAALGLNVIVPDLFWRLEPGVELGYGEPDRQRAFALLQQFDVKRGAQDLNETVAWLESQPGLTSSVALLGFCLGGRLVVLAAAANPTVAAVISFYGVRLNENLTELRALSCPFQFHVGDRDGHVPSESVAAIERACVGMPNAELFVYQGAGHAFFNPDRVDAYDPHAARRARGRTLTALLGRKESP